MEIGRRIYYDKKTGNVILETGEMCGFIKKTSIDEDFESYQALKNRVKETVAIIELTYGFRREDFLKCTGYRIDVEKDVVDSNAIIFDFTPQQIDENCKRKTLEEELSAIKEENKSLKQQLVQCQQSITELTALASTMLAPTK